MSNIAARLSRTLHLALVAVLYGAAFNLHAATMTKKEIIAYVFPQDRVLAPGEIAARKVTRINYAFANIKDGEIVEGFAHDAENFAILDSLKRENPSLKVLVSVGGWT